MTTTNTQHTPAPWRVTGFIKQTIFISSDVHGAICMIPTDGKAIDEHNANAQLIARAPELLKENEQLKDNFEAKNQAYYYEKNQAEQLKALNAELLEALKQLHETTRKINPEYWGAYTPNALSYAEKLIAKAEGKH